MIIHTILIKELPDGTVFTAMRGDNRNETLGEVAVASVLNEALRFAGEAIVKKTGCSMAEGVGLDEAIKEFIAREIEKDL